MAGGRDRYQGIVIVSAEKPFRGEYKAVNYRPEKRGDFDRDVREKKTQREEVVEDSSWLDKPVSQRRIAAIGKGMIRKMWGTR